MLLGKCAIRGWADRQGRPLQAKPRRVGRGREPGAACAAGTGHPGQGYFRRPKRGAAEQHSRSTRKPSSTSPGTSTRPAGNRDQPVIQTRYGPPGRGCTGAGRRHCRRSESFRWSRSRYARQGSFRCHPRAMQLSRMAKGGPPAGRQPSPMPRAESGPRVTVRRVTAPGAHLAGSHEVSQACPPRTELCPGSGELQDRDRSGREFSSADGPRRTRFSSPAVDASYTARSKVTGRAARARPPRAAATAPLPTRVCCHGHSFPGPGPRASLAGQDRREAGTEGSPARDTG